MNKGIFPIGSITTNNAMTAVIISVWKVSGTLIKSWRGLKNRRQKFGRQLIETIISSDNKLM